MKLGFSLPQVGDLAGRENVSLVARRAEELGFDSVWVIDRLMIPDQPRAPYPASADGILPEAFKRVLDPLDTLSFVAAITERVGLGSSILNLPFYNPALLARRLATLDVLSGGRAQIGFGVGWSPDEFEAVGTAFTNRGKRTDEAIQVLKAIWGPDPVAFDGEFYKIAKSVIGLKPVQEPHPPIYFAAYNPAAMRRTALHGNGWARAGIPLEVMAQMFGQIKAMAAEAGCDPDAMEMVVRPSQRILDQPLGSDRAQFSGAVEQVVGDLVALQGIGATEVIFDVQFSPTVGSIDDYLDAMDEIYTPTKAAS